MKDRLYINGQVQQDPLPVPTTAQVLQMSPPDRDEVIKSGPAMFSGEPALLGGHMFTATVARVFKLEDVKAAYLKLLMNPSCAGASHNVAGYALYNPLTAKTTQGYQDDREYGAGRFLLQLLQRRNRKNIVVFITRRFTSSTHLGPARFDAMEKAVDSALKFLKD